MIELLLIIVVVLLYCIAGILMAQFIYEGVDDSDYTGATVMLWPLLILLMVCVAFIELIGQAWKSWRG